MHPSGGKENTKRRQGKKRWEGEGRKRRRDERVRGLAKIKSNVKEGPGGISLFGDCTFHSPVINSGSALQF